MTDMPDPREFDECAYEGWGQADWLAVDARLARLGGAGELRGRRQPVPPSFPCVTCECGGQCDQCKGAGA